MPDGFSVDARGLDDLARKLRHAAHTMERDVRPTLTKVGLAHAETAKAIVAPHSRTVAASIHVTSIPNGVMIEAGGDGVPLAVLYEKGNHKGRGKGFDSQRRMITGSRVTSTRMEVDMALSFRHPVYGNKSVWVDQQRHPFFAPARAKLRRWSQAQMEAAGRRSLERSGLNRG